MVIDESSKQIYRDLWLTSHIADNIFILTILGIIADIAHLNLCKALYWVIHILYHLWFNQYKTIFIFETTEA